MPNFASSLTVAQYRALGFAVAPGPHPVAIFDTGAAIAAMTLDEFEELVWKGIDILDATDGTLSLTVSQYTALGGNTLSGGDGASLPEPTTIALAASDVVTLSDTRAALSTLTAARIAALAAKGVDKIDATDDLLNLTVAKYNALGTVALTAADVVTLADTGAALSALTPAQIAGLAGKGIDKLDAMDNALSLSVAQYQALGAVTFTAADVVTLGDSGAALAALTAAQIAALAGKGVDKIDATDNALALTVAQYAALGTVTLAAADVVTLADTGVALAALTSVQIAALAGNGVDKIDATDNVLALSVAQLNALGPVTLTAADVVTLADTGAALAALTAVQVATLAGKGIDKIDATDNAVTVTVVQYAALGTVTLTAADIVTLADAGGALAALTGAQISALAGNGIDKLDATDDALSLSVAQYQALGAVTLTTADVVTLADTGAALAALTAVQIAALPGKGIDRIDATDNALTLTVAQYQALGAVALVAADVVTLADTGAALAALTAVQIAALAGKGVDKIDATDNTLALTVTQYAALGTVTLAAADVVTLADTGAALAALTAVQIAALAGKGVDKLDATDNALTLALVQYTALGAVTLAAADVVTLADTGAAIAALTAVQLAALAGKGIDRIDATDNALALTVAQYAALGGVTLAAADVVTLADTGALLTGLSVAQISALAGKGIDKLDATDNALILSVVQYQALGAVTLTAADVVTLADTGAALATLTAAQISALAGKGVDRIDATDDILTLSLAMYTALGAVTLAAADVVTLADTGAALAASTPAQIAALASKGIDKLDATDNALSLTVAQYTSLGAVTLTAADVVTLADAGAALAALTAAQIVALAGNGIDKIDATDDTLSLTVAQYTSLGTATLSAADVVTLADTGAALAALTAAQIAMLAGNGIDKLDATDNALTLTVAQFGALGTVTLAAADVVTLADTGVALAALTTAQFAALAGKGIDKVDATDNILTLSVAQFAALGAVALTVADTVTLADPGAALATLTAAQIATLAGKGIDRIDATDDILTFSLAMYTALGTVTLTTVDVVTLADTGAVLSAMTAPEIAALSGKGIDRVDATDNTLALTVAQYTSLGAVTLAAVDVVILADTGAALAALTPAQIAALASKGIDRIDATDNALSLTVAQYTSLGAVTLTAADVVTLVDTGAALAALTAAQIAALAGKGVDKVDATDNTISLTVAQYIALGTVTLTAADVVTLADTGAALAALTAVQIGMLGGNGIDKLDATDNALSLTVAQYTALGTVTLAVADLVTLADTGAALAALTAVQIAALAGKGIDKVDATDNTLILSVAQYTALGAITLVAADVVTLADTGAALAALTAAQITGLAARNIDKVDATDNTLTLTVAQYNALGAVTLTAADTVTLAGAGAAFAALTAAQIAALASKGVDRIDSTDNTLMLTVAQYSALGTVTLTASDVVTLADTGAALAALTAVQIAALAGKGVDKIDATDNTLSLTVAQYNALGAVTMTTADTVTLADTGAAVAALTAAQIAALAGKGVDKIDATNNTLSLTVAQYTALGAVVLTPADVVTLADTGAALAVLTSVQIAALAGKGIDCVDATDNTFTLTVAQYQALGAVALAAGDVVTLVDTGIVLAGLTAPQIAALAGASIDKLDASDSALALTVAQYQALGAVTLTAADLVTLADTGAALAALTAVQVAALAGNGIDSIDATDNMLVLTVAQYQALGAVTLASADVVTLADAGTALATLTAAQVAALAGKGIDKLDATDNVLGLTVAQYAALGAVTLTAADVVTLADTGAALAALTPMQIGALAANGIDGLDATDNTLVLTVAQYGALGAVTLTASDTVTLADAGSALATLTSVQIAALAGKGIDRLDAADNVLTLSLAQYQALGAVTLVVANVVTLADTGAALAALTSVQIAALAGKGVDKIDATDNTLILSVAQYQALGAVTLGAADVVTLADTGASFAALTAAQVAALAGKGIDKLDATDNVLGLTVAQYAALGAVTLTAADLVTLADTGAALAALTSDQIASLAGKGVDRIDATDNALALSVAQYQALGAVTLTAADVVTLADTGAALAALTSVQIAELAGKGVDRIDASDNVLVLTIAQYGALGAVTLAASDAVTLADTGAALAALTTAQIAALAANGIDKLDATDNTLALTVAQYIALGAVTLTASDAVTLADTGAALATLTVVQFAALAGKGIDKLDATDNTLVLTAAQYLALGAVTLTAADVVTLADTGAALATLTSAQVAALAGNGIDKLDATDNVLALTVSQYTALGAVTLAAADVVTLADTGAVLAVLTAAQVAALAVKGVDKLDATDGVLGLTIAQYTALGAVTLTPADVVSLADTGAALAALTAVQIAALAGKGIDRLDATDNVLTLSLAQYQSLGIVTLAVADVVMLADTGAALASLTAVQIAELAGKGIDKLDVTDNALTLTGAQYGALGAVTLTAADLVVLADTGAALAALTAAQVAALAGKGIDRLDATDNVLSLTVAQFTSLGSVVLTAADVVTLADTGAAIEVLTSVQIAALAGKGIDTLDATDNVLTLSLSQFQALGAVTFATADVVTLTDTGAALAALTPVQIAALAGKGIDKLDASDNVLTFSLVQYQALGVVTFAGADAVTLADTGAALAALTAAQFGALAGRGIDRLDATDGVLALTVAQYLSLGGVTLTVADAVTLADTGAALATLSAAQFSALAGAGVDRIDATDNVLALSVVQYQALGAVTLTAADVVTLADIGSALAALTSVQIAALAANGIDQMDATDNALMLTVAQYGALGAVTLTVSDTVTLADTGAALAALTSVQIAGLAGNGIDRLDATDNVLALTVAQYGALGAVTLTASDAVTLTDTGSAIAALTSVQIASLAGKNIDKIDSTNNLITLSVAQYQALGIVTLTALDVVTLADTGAALAALTSVQIAALAGKGIDTLDATDNALILNVAQYSALGAVALAAADAVTLADTGTALAALTSVQIAALAGKGVDKLDATDNALSLSVAQYLALGAVTLTTADVVTLADTGAAFAALTAVQIAALAGKGIDKIDATDNALTLSLAQYQALGTVALAAGDAVTLTDTGAALAALTSAQIAALAGKNVDRIDSSNNTLSLTVAQFQALGAVLLTMADTVTLADISANLDTLTAVQIAALAGAGIDRVDATDNVLALSLADYQALGTVTLTVADQVTLADAGAGLGALSPAQIAALAGLGIDAINATDDALTLSVAQYRALGTVTLTGADYVILADTSANLATLTPAENAALAGKGIDDVETTDFVTIETALASYTLDASANNLTFIGTGAFAGTGNALDNTITGGASNDTLRGLAGNDMLIGGAGDDTLIGGTGADVLNGGGGSADWASYIDATAGVTASLTNPGSNTGEAAGDTYIGLERLAGSAFNDTLIGDAGDNSLRGLAGADHLDGGAGRDTASYFTATSGLTVSLDNPANNTGEAVGDTYVSIENISGSAYNDVLTGNGSDNTLLGNGGADILDGGGGFDYASYDNSTAGVTASLANPALNTGEAAGDVYISIEALAGSAFDDVLIGNSGDNTLQGQAGADQLDGGGGFDYASYFYALGAVTASLTNPAGNTGEAAGDTYISIEGLSGSRFDDVLVGNASDNWLNGQGGADHLDGSGGFDFASYSNATTGVTASIADQSVNTGEAAGDVYTSIEGLGGSSFADILIGDANNNNLRGQGGADQLDGGGGFDYASYNNATSGVTASLDTSLPISNTGEAAGDTYVSIEGLAGSSFADILVGNAVANILIGNSGADVFYGGAGNDTFYGNTQTSGTDGSTDRVDYSQVTGLSQGISVNWLAGSVIGQAGIIDTDSLFNIESIYGTAFADMFDATGYSGSSARAGDYGGYQLIRGGGGNDTIIGNNNTEVTYGDATGGVTVTLSIVAGVYGGTVTGAGVGTDQVTNVNRFIGSLYNDTFWGTSNAEIFDGNEGGDDVFHGGSNLDVVEYDSGNRMAIDVNLAAGIVTGRVLGSNIGTDTLDSIERIRGSEFDDRFDATGFSGSSTNAGSSGTFNRFEGQGGADEVIGNGNTYLDYFNTSSSITVTMSGQGAGSVLATYGSNIATDTFTGVFGINGGNSSDTFIGAGGTDTFFGQNGGDLLQGGAGNDSLEGGTGADFLDGGADFDTASYFNAAAGVNASLVNPGSNTGDAAGDIYISIEGLAGSGFADTLTGDGGANTLIGNNGDDILIGRGGADQLNGGDGSDYASYAGAATGVTASLANPAANTGDAAGDIYISIERLEGSAFDDILIGDSSNNTLRGGLGADQLNGGGGFDYASYYNAAAGVTASLANPGANTGEAAGDTYVSIEGLSGSAFADILTGDGGDNTLIGQGGADQLDGGAGQDYASYQNATAGVTASLANPAINTGEAAGDTYISIEHLAGTSFNDILIGDGGSNSLTGLDGADQLDGGAGFDYAIYTGASAGLTASLDTSLPFVNTGEAAGDTYISIEGISGTNFADILVGNAVSNALVGNGGGDLFYGGAGNDFFYGNSTTVGTDGATDRVDYSQVTGLSQGISVNWLAGSVTGQAGIIDTDSMFGIESVYGTAFADTFDATGYSGSSARAGDYGGYQLIRGGGGNDTIIGNNNTEVTYGDATGGVTVTLSIVAGVYGGTVTGAGVGTDQVTNVNRFIGSLYNDTFWGTSNAEIFDGNEGGDDVFHGGANLDVVEYDGGNRMAIDVNLAAGIVTGRVLGSNIGTDTLDSIERIRGSEFDDRFDATGFSGSSTNAGSSGTFNRFEGQGGADEVIGNGNTYLDYFNTSSSISVTMTGQGAGSATATYGSNTATDTFTGVSTIYGGNFNDTFSGAGGNDIFFAQSGNDMLLGGAGNDTLEGGAGADLLNGGADFDTASYLNAAAGVNASLTNPASNTGDAAGDSYISIESLAGSGFADTLNGDADANTLVGNNGDDILIGRGGADQLNGGDGSDYASYTSAATGVTASLANSAINTGDAAGDTYISIERIEGSAFNDILFGDAFDNTLRGGLGADQLNGGNGFDYASYYNAATGVTASLANPGANTGEAIGDVYISIEGLSGSAFADILIGDSGDNWLIGQGGADQLDGGLGSDFAGYQNATAAVTVSLLNPAVNTGEAAGDSYISIENLGGSSFNDILIGDGGNNVLRGQEGADQLDGGAGSDTASYVNASAGVTASLDTSFTMPNAGEAAGDTYVSIENLSGSNFGDTLAGDALDNILIGNGGGDIFYGGAGTDTFYGNTQTSNFDGTTDRVDYSQVTGLSQGISVNWLAGSVTGQAGIIGTDSMFGIESVFGTAFADTFDATGYSGASARAGDFGGYQLIRGGGGNDTIIGNGSTELLYGDATGSVTVTLSIVSGIYGGTVTGAGVGTDQITNVSRFIGSLYNDTFWGTSNAEIFDGFDGGDDVFHGGANFDTVEYDGGSRQAIDVNMAAGTIIGRAPGSNIGSDTLDSIERIRGSEFADRYNAVGFSGISANAGSSGTGNMFEGQGGADEVMGNGSTSLVYFNASSSVFVTMTGQGSGTVNANYGSNFATDTFTGVFQIYGSSFNDTFSGGGGNDYFLGQGGNDLLFGNAGNDTLEGGAGGDTLDGGANFDVASYAAATSGVTASLATPGTNTGDAAGDSYFSIEGLTGSNFNDTLKGDGSSNILVGGLGADVLIGGSTNINSYDQIDYASYANSGFGITVSLATPASNTGEAAGDSFDGINGLIGSGFDDFLTGVTFGNNIFIGGFGNDHINGGQGYDVSRYDTATAAITVNMATGIVNGGAGQDTLSSVEGIWGSNFADTYDASAYTEFTAGASFHGANSFEGFGGADTIIGSTAFSTGSSYLTATMIEYMHGTAGIIVNMSSATAGTVTATYGTDTSTDTFSNVNGISGSNFDDTFNGTDGAQGFFAGGGNDVLHGGAGNDELYGSDGDDFLDGGSGDDMLYAGAGSDVVDGGDGIDTVVYYEANGVTASLENSAVNIGDAAGDTYSSIENLVGSYQNDTLIGNSGNNTIDGITGSDVFNGRGGIDTLVGNGGGDTFVFNSAIGPGNLATIVGFAHGQDHFNLENAIFTQLGSVGQLDASAFVNGTAALDANDRIVFDSATGNVMYDADGSGAGAAVVVAKMQSLSGGPLDHADFLII